MKFPMEAFFAILAIEVFRAFGPTHNSTQSATFSIIITLVWIALQYAIAFSLASRTKRKLRLRGRNTRAIIENYRFLQMIQSIILIVLSVVHTYYTQWPTLVAFSSPFFLSSLLEDILAVLPFVAVLATSWLASYKTNILLSGRQWKLQEYIWFHIRYSLLLVLAPWLVLRTIQNLIFTSQEALSISNHKSLGPFTLITILILLIIFMPLFLKKLFGTVSMPDGPLKTKLQAMAAKSGLKYRDILIWKTNNARILNAAVIGAIPKYRYILISETLLETLTQAECEAVFAHELGHTHYSHIFVYLIFTIGFVALSGNILSLLPVNLQNDYLIGMPILAILVILYFRVFFGYISRMLERQADVYATGLIGNPASLTVALEKIALASGDVRDIHSWRHHSVKERIRYLSSVGYSPELHKNYHEHAARGVRFVIAFVIIVVGISIRFSMQEPRGISAVRSHLNKIATNKPWHSGASAKLGELNAALGKTELAVENIAEALNQNPINELALKTLQKLDISKSRKLRIRTLAFFDAGWSKQALEFANKAVEIDSANPANYIVLSNILSSREHPDIFDAKWAQREALRALKLEDKIPSSNSALAHGALARAYIGQNRLTRAYQLLQKVIENHKNNPELEKEISMLKALMVRTKNMLNQPK